MHPGEISQDPSPNLTNFPTHGNEFRNLAVTDLETRYLPLMDTSSHSHNTLVLSHESALRALRFARCRYYLLPWDPLDKHDCAGALEHARVNCDSIDWDELARLGLRADDGSPPLDVLIGSCRSKRQAHGIRQHIAGVKLPGRSLYRLGLGIACAGPELVFTQLCGELAPEQSMALGYELCGTFSMSEDHPARPARDVAGAGIDRGVEGARCSQATDAAARTASYMESEAVTNTRAIGEFLDATTRLRGTKQARRAARYVLDGARSPMEAIMAAMFHASHQRGGFGVAGMLLNHLIDFNAAATRISGLPYAVCDAYIPAARTALEYNGHDHDAPKTRIRDEKRMLGLEAMGIKTFPINESLLQEVEALEEITRLIYRRAGKRYQNRARASRTQQVRLLNGMREFYGLPPC